MLYKYHIGLNLSPNTLTLKNNLDREVEEVGMGSYYYLMDRVSAWGDGKSPGDGGW